MTAKQPTAGRREGAKADAIPQWSWIIAAVGLVLVVGSAGFMLYRAFAADASPPDLVVETTAVVPRTSGYLVQIRVMNHGGSAAAGATVEGVLKEGSATVETSAITVDYVPSGSERRAGLFFSRDPGKFDLEIQAKGYLQP